MKDQYKIIRILNYLKIVKIESYMESGKPITNGANPYNPLTYLLAIPLILLGGLVGFFEGIVETFYNIF